MRGKRSANSRACAKFVVDSISEILAVRDAVKQIERAIKIATINAKKKIPPNAPYTILTFDKIESAFDFKDSESNAFVEFHKLCDTDSIEFNAISACLFSSVLPCHSFDIAVLNSANDEFNFVILPIIAIVFLESYNAHALRNSLEISRTSCSTATQRATKICICIFSICAEFFESISDNLKTSEYNLGNNDDATSIKI